MFLLLPSNSAQSVVPESVLISSVPVSLLVKIEDACLNLGLFFLVIVFKLGYYIY